MPDDPMTPERLRAEFPDMPRGDAVLFDALAAAAEATLDETEPQVASTTPTSNADPVTQPLLA